MRNRMMGLLLFALCLSSWPALAESKRSAAPAAQATTSAPSGVVNLNEATMEQLEYLPGVGPSRARAIIEYRKSHPFRRVEELTRVKGLGKKSFARLKPLVALSGPTTLSARPRDRR